MKGWTVYLQSPRGVWELGRLYAIDAECALLVARREYPRLGPSETIGVVVEGSKLPSHETREMLENPKGHAGYWANAKAFARAGFRGQRRKRDVGNGRQ